MAILKLKNISVVYGTGHAAIQAVDNVSVEVEEGEFFCLLGPSGCGKSTLLKIISGLLRPKEGSMDLNVRSSVEGIQAGMVWQEPTLMPWRTVEDNAAFFLEIRGVPRSRRQAIAAKTLKAVGIAEFAKKYPRELSGGMRQRVGIARALIADPQILLMDEPFASVDAQTRMILQELVLSLWEEFKKTVVFVTHNIEEAILLGDRIAVMTARPGRIKTTISVPFSRPRDSSIRKAKEFQELEESIWELLRMEAVQAEMEEIEG
jgi:ABC-type nitrate/sulfonate/bicarbonate transport system ATPase subunit